MHAFRKFFALSSKEKCILAQAWVLFPLTDLALRTIRFRYLLRLTQKICETGREKAGPELTPSLERLVWLVEIAGRHSIVNSTCLKQALVLSWILGRRGHTTSLHIGVARSADTLAAHAWLERRGQVVFGHTEVRYEPLIHT